MSSPATSCARKWVDTASSYCSRQRAFTMASRKVWRPSEAVCQSGRGSEPTTDVGSRMSADALYMSVLFDYRPESADGGAIRTYRTHNGATIGNCRQNRFIANGNRWLIPTFGDPGLILRREPSL